jgi:predicted nucleotidyltransferase
MKYGMLDLLPAHQALVCDILRAHLRPPAQVWVFGSRVRGRAQKYSDLDIAIDAGARLTLAEMALLNDAFNDSDLPWKVDLVDWRAIEPAFARLIEADLIELQFAAVAM